MHGEEGHALACRALHPARHRIADVVQLEIEEHTLAGGQEGRRQRQAALQRQLVSDLVEADVVAERVDDALGVAERRHVEGHDQPIARRQYFAHAKPRAMSTSRCTTLFNSPAIRSSLIRSASSNALAASRTATCSGITRAPQPSSSTWRSAISERMPP